MNWLVNLMSILKYFKALGISKESILVLFSADFPVLAKC